MATVRGGGEAGRIGEEGSVAAKETSERWEWRGFKGKKERRGGGVRREECWAALA